MKTTEYILEIYEPQSGSDVLMTFSSSSPFMTISAGDILNPRTWDKSISPKKVFRVINIEHIIWKSGTQVKHKVCVFTEEVDDTSESRLSRG